MLHVTTAGCVTEETAECRIPMKPGARNRRTMAWQECFGVLRREFIEFDIPGLSEKGFQDAGGVMYGLPSACLYWMNSSMAGASFIGGLLIRSWRPPGVSSSVPLPSPP